MTLNDLREYMRINVDATATDFTNEFVSFIRLMQSSGVSTNEIKKVLVNDLKESGRIFGALKNRSKSIVRNGIESAATIAADEVFTEAGVKRWRWVAAGNNVCPDCANRAGVIGTLEYFDIIGNPKSGFSVCGQNCQCQKVPVEYTQEENIIKKNKK